VALQVWRTDAGVERVDLLAEGLDAPGDAAQRDPRRAGWLGRFGQVRTPVGGLPGFAPQGARGQRLPDLGGGGDQQLTELVERVDAGSDRAGASL
jgi:hypothetical protein